MAIKKDGLFEMALQDYAIEVVRRAKSNVKIQQKIGNKKGNRYATGALYDSLTYNYKYNNGQVFIDFGTNNAAVQKYAGVIEYGRRPGAKMPPVDAIFRWMSIRKVRLRDFSNPDPMKKGRFIPYSEEKAMQAAWNIARAIGKRGIPGIRYFNDALSEVFDDGFGNILGEAYGADLLQSIAAVLKQGENGKFTIE